jgi:hypothetical protein
MRKKKFKNHSDVTINGLELQITGATGSTYKAIIQFTLSEGPVGNQILTI